MSTYTHTLTEIEEACGVTLEAVAEVLPRAYVFDSAAAIMLPKDTPPALCSSTARCAFAGAEVEFSHIKKGYPIYRKVS